MPPIAKKYKESKEMELHSKAEKSPVVSGQLEKQIENRKSKLKNHRTRPERGVLFIKNLPHGFYEAQLKSFFKQFGKVTNLRLVRSRKTAASKGYAFVEFQVPEVAQIAAETMDNYIMFQKLVRAAYIPPEQQKFNYFKSSVRKVRNSTGKIKFVSSKSKMILRKMKAHNDWNDNSFTKRIKGSMKKLEKMKEKYANLGINFDDLTVKPNVIREQYTILQSNQDSETSSDDCKYSDNLEPQNLILVKKQKISEDVNPKIKKRNKSKNVTADLKSILENSMPEEDSSDEDFIPELEDDTESDSEESNQDTELKNLAEDEQGLHSKKEANNKYEPMPDLLDKLIERKHHLGAVQKVYKQSNKTKPSGKKEKMKVAAAKEILRNEKVPLLKKKVKK